MKILITLVVLATLVLGFSLSWLLVISKFHRINRVLKSIAFVLLGSVFSVFGMALEIFIVWPA